VLVTRYAAAGGLGSIGMSLAHTQTDPDDHDSSAFETGGAMAQLVQQSVGSQSIRAAALQAIAALPQSATRRQKADAVWHWVHTHMTLVPHEELACEFAGRCDGQAQFLMSPELALRVGKGDCAIYTPLVCSMLFSVGVPCRMIPVAADSSDRRRLSHVYAAAVLEDGSLYPLDASHGPRPGWQTPTPRREVWPVFGLPLW